MPPSRVLVTGAAGFVGSALCHALIAAGYDVTGLVRLGSDLARLRDDEGRMLVRALATGEPVATLFEGGGFDTVIHAATNYGRSGATHADLVHDNIVLPLAISEAHELSSDNAFFVNIDSFFSRLGRESLHLRPYATTKRQLREWLEQRRASSVTVNLRLEHVYGPGDSSEKFVPWLLSKLTAAPPVRVPLAEGLAERDFIYISDVTAAILAVIQAAARHRPGVTEYEVGMGQAMRVRDFVELALSIADSSAALDFGALNVRDGELPFSQANNTELRALGWSPSHTPAQGLRKCVDSLRSGTT